MDKMIFSSSISYLLLFLVEAFHHYYYDIIFVILSVFIVYYNECYYGIYTVNIRLYIDKIKYMIIYSGVH